FGFFATRANSRPSFVRPSVPSSLCPSVPLVAAKGRAVPSSDGSQPATQNSQLARISTFFGVFQLWNSPSTSTRRRHAVPPCPNNDNQTSRRAASASARRHLPPDSTSHALAGSVVMAIQLETRNSKRETQPSSRMDSALSLSSRLSEPGPLRQNAVCAGSSRLKWCKKEPPRQSQPRGSPHDRRSVKFRRIALVSPARPHPRRRFELSVPPCPGLKLETRNSKLPSRVLRTFSFFAPRTDFRLPFVRPSVPLSLRPSVPLVTAKGRAVPSWLSASPKRL